jgi:translocation protein SEC62
MASKVKADGALPATPEGIAIAKFLRYNSALKSRTGVLNGKRVEFFKGALLHTQNSTNNRTGKRVVRLLLSDAYKKKASKKKSILPKVETQEQAIAAFRLLLAPLLALRVQKVSAHEGHDHGHKHSKSEKPLKDKEGKKKKKKKKMKSSTKPKHPPHLQIQQDQSLFKDDDYFAWFYDTTQLQTILGGIGIVIAVFGAILFPLWPPILRIAVWYLSIVLLGLIGGILVIAIVRLILFVITMFAVPPGIWLFPNLFEDVGFFESFVPLWGWHKLLKSKRKKTGLQKKVGHKTSAVKAETPGKREKEPKDLHTTVEDAPEEE